MIPNTTVTAIRTFSLGERALSEHVTSVEKIFVLQTDVNSSQQVKLLNNGRNRDEYYFQGCPLFNGRNMWTDRQGVNSLSIVNRDVVHFSKCPLLEVPLKYICGEAHVHSYSTSIVSSSDTGRVVFSQSESFITCVTLAGVICSTDTAS